ncbi:MAG: winged helix-turn-helix transcriptional regulator [Lachnospiraceae bacterium]|nr:winged helix-turn-helix transcriptional regulator [Lachnospiraceae bacterium]
MSREFNLSVRSEPFWLQEAFTCMNYVPMLDSEEWLNKSDGWSRRQKEEFLFPYRSYRGSMRTRLQPIMAQFSLLAGYVDSAPREQESSKSSEPPMMLFLVEIQHVLEAEELPPEEELETELNLAFQRMLESSLPDSHKISEGGLSDVMAALEGWQGSDADKFKMLRLYSERREVMDQLWSFQEFCTEIGRECLESVQERFDACMEELKKPETAERLLERVGIQGGEKFSGQITPVILPYNRCRIELRTLQENPWHFKTKFHIGIETFYLQRSEEEAFCQDEGLLARLKALSDLTRLKILHQLAEHPCYLQEMAKALGLTPATVLHHVSVLMAERLIEIQVTTEKKKVYYRIKKQGLEEVSQGILQLAMTREEREEQRKRQIQEGQQDQGGIQWIIQK